MPITKIVQFIEEIEYLFQDDIDLENIQLGLLELPFVNIDDTELYYTLFRTEEFHKFRIYRPTKESIIIDMAQGNLQAAQINFSPYIDYNDKYNNLYHSIDHNNNNSSNNNRHLEQQDKVDNKIMIHY